MIPRRHRFTREGEKLYFIGRNHDAALARLHADGIDAILGGAMTPEQRAIFTDLRDDLRAVAEDRGDERLEP